MQFIMYPYGGKSAIITDDYTPSEVNAELHIEHLREDMHRIGGKYPAKVFTGDMMPYALLYGNKVEYCNPHTSRNDKKRGRA